MGKQIYTRERIHEALQSILIDMQNTVLSTIGPNGSLVGLDVNNNTPHNTKDGVTVADFITYSDRVHNLLFNIIKEPSRNLNAEVGDGTTTSMLLIVSAIQAFLDLVKQNKTLDLEEFKSDIYRVIEFIEDVIRPVDMNSKEIEAIAKISSNNDQEVVQLLMNITAKIGKHGIIEVQEDENIDNIEIKISDGAYIDAKILNKVYNLDQSFQIMLIEGIIDNSRILQDVINASQPAGNLLIIAKEFSIDVIDIVDINNAKTSSPLNIVLLTAEGLGSNRLKVLEDIALVTNATVLSTDKATTTSLRDVKPTHLGYIDNVSAYNNGVVLHYDSELLQRPDIQKHVKDLTDDYSLYASKTDSKSIAMQHALRMRLYKFVSMALIQVGGITKASMKERKDRIDDAVHAIAASVEGGIIPGGGSVLAMASKLFQLDQKPMMEKLCFAPFIALTGSKEKLITQLDSDDKVYNVVTKDFENIAEANIFDPAYVLIKSLRNVISVMEIIAKLNSLVIDDYVQEH